MERGLERARGDARVIEGRRSREECRNPRRAALLRTRAFPCGRAHGVPPRADRPPRASSSARIAGGRSRFLAAARCSVMQTWDSARAHSSRTPRALSAPAPSWVRPARSRGCMPDRRPVHPRDGWLSGNSCTARAVQCLALHGTCRAPKAGPPMEDGPDPKAGPVSKKDSLRSPCAPWPVTRPDPSSSRPPRQTRRGARS